MKTLETSSVKRHCKNCSYFFVSSEEKHELIAKLASMNGVSTAWIIRYALNEFLEKYGSEKELKIKPVKE